MRRLLGYTLFTAVYWAVALVVFLVAEIEFDSFGAGDGLGASGGVVAVTWLLLSIAGYVWLLRNGKQVIEGEF